MRTILLPTDFSEHALNACSYAFDLFGVSDVTYVLVHTYVDVLPGYDDLVDMTSTQYAEGVEHMAAFIEHLHSTQRGRDAVLVSMVVAGPLVSALKSVCGSRAVDAIAMGTLGATGLALFGSNASAVAKGSDVPVLVVPSGARYTGLKRILIADDGGPENAEGMELAAGLAQRDHAHIALAHVVQEGPVPFDAGALALRKARFKDLEFSVVDASGVDVAHALNSLADRIQADLVVVQHRHMGLLDSLFHTSVAARMALHVRVPLLVLEH